MDESSGVSGSADSADTLSPAARALLARRARLSDPAATLGAGKGSRESGRSARLSSWQQSIWFFDQLEPGCDAYNRAKRLRLVGPLDLVALEASLAGIFRKHEVLRSRVVLEDGSPTQCVVQTYEFKLPVIDLRALSAASRAERYSEITNQVAHAPFDLMSGPWARATLVREAEDVHTLLFTAHHIAFDGWSTSVFANELAEGYRRNMDGMGSGGEAITTQYADFAESQRNRLDGSAFDKQLDYWAASLLGAPPVLELPADHPRPIRRSNAAGTASAVIPASTVERLHVLGREENATLFMTVLAAFQLWLARLSGQDDIVVGTPVAGRNSVSSEKMIGCYMNVLPMRARVDAGRSFRDLLRTVRGTVLNGLAHQDVPFDAIVNRIQPERNLAHAPLTQVLFNFRNTIPKAPVFPGLTVEIGDIPAGTLVSDFEFEMEQSSEGLRCLAVYNAELFDAATVTRWLGHFQTLISGVIEAPDAPVSRLPLLTSAERHLMVVEWNSPSTAHDYETCLHHLIEAQARKTPDATAICGESGTLTYAALNRRANILARDLARRGVSPGGLVGINMERCADLVVALLAVLKAGGAYVPLDPEYPLDRLAFMVSDSKPLILLTQRSLDSPLDAGQTPVIFVDAKYWASASSSDDRDLTIDVQPGDLAYVIYTSGSTGRPKGAMNTHRAVCNLLLRNRDSLELEAHDVTLLRTTISFDLSVKEMFLPLIVGGKVVAARANDSAEPEYVARVIEQYGITILFVVPTLLRLLLDVPGLEEKLATVRLTSSGGETLSTALLERYFALLRMPIQNAYGPTETAVDTLHWRCERDDRHHTVPIGRPITNDRVYILDSNGEPVPPGVTGEIYIGGVGIGRGYLNRPELTAERFLPDPFVDGSDARMYRTGDLARFDKDGVVEILGRMDGQVKLRGVRIELGEIEAALSGVDNVRECAVVLRDDAPGGRGLVAYVVANDNAKVSEASLRKALRAKLLPAMVPSAFVMMDVLPLTPSRKIDRRALPAPLARLRKRSPSPLASQTPTESIISAIWASVLKQESIGVEDDFFELGGHSLSATQVIARLRSIVQGDFPVGLLFDNPTVASLAAAIDERSGDNAAAPGKPIHMDRDRRRDNNGAFREAPLSFVQEQLWLVDQLQPGNTAYVIGCTVEFTGALDPMALRAALTEIVRRHEVLRTSIAMRDGVPVQVIQPAGEAELRVTRLTELSEPDREARAQQIERDESEGAFDLTVGSPIRFHLVEVDPEHHRLIVSAHHIALDGWSVQIFIRELGELYSATLSGSTAVLPEPAWQYADFATWQREEMSSGVLEPLVEYWRNQLDGAPPVNGLALDRPRPAARTFAGGAVSLVIEPETAAGLRALAKESGATLFMTMLAAYMLLLSRLSGERDVVVGVPIAGRTRVETETMLGCFLNTLPFRTQVDPDSSFRELLSRVRTVALGAYAHQEVPFDLLVERLNPQRSLSYGPFFQVFFNMLNMPGAPEGPAHVRVQRRDGAEASAKFELTMYVQERGDDISLRFVYSTDVYTAAHARVMLQQYCELLNQIVAAPGEPVSEYSLVTPAQLGILPNPAAPQNRDWYGSVAELFAARAASAPDAPAVVDGATTWTYRTLDTRGNQLAHHLALLGVAKGDVVAIYAERSAALVWALLAVFKSGGAFVVLDRSYPAQRLADYVGKVRPRVAIALAEAGPLPALLSKALVQIGTVVCPLPPFSSEMTRDDLWRCPTTPPDISVSPDDTAYVAFTSGTTGEPKGIVGRHGSLTHFTSWTAAEFGLNVTDRYSLLSGLAHDPLHRDLFTSLQLGACVCVPAPAVVYDPARLRTWMRESGITVAHLTPAMGQLLASSSSERSIDSLRLAFFVGDALTRRDVARLHAIAPNVRIVNYYGTTETQRAVGLYVTRRAPRSECEHEVVPLGHGLPDVQLLVVTPAGRLAGIGELGEIYVRSPHIAKSYFADEQLTLERFVVNPITREAADMCYRTGDLGRYDLEGDVVAAGRSDSQVKIRGFRVELAEIEATLGRHPLVSDCVVTAPIAADSERRLAAYIVARAPAPTIGELRAVLRERLPSYMNVSSFTFLDSLPLTPNGKIDRRALPSPQFDSVSHSSNGYAKGPVEFELARLWQDLLHVPSVGVDDDFFDLGGHSLLAAAMMQRVATMFGMNPPLSTLFEEPTIRHLANSLRKDAAFIEQGAICIQRGLTGRTPLFYFHGDYTGGGLYCRKLIRYLDRDMPMYVIAPHEAGGPETIESMAADLLPHIREIQQHGPYVLAGYCNGGVVALEVATQLRESGEPVEFLAVIDVGARNVQLASLYALLNRIGGFLGFDQRRRLDTFMLLREPALRFLDTELPPIDTSSGFGERAIFTAALISLMTRRVIRRAWRAVTRTLSSGRLETTDPVVQREPLHPDDRRRLASSQYISRAMLSYVPRQYDRTITVIGATEGREDASIDHLHNWRSIAKRVDAFVIPGTHLGIVTSDIAGLGELLRAQIPRI